MITKSSLLNSLDSMPDEFSVEDIIDRILLLEKIYQGEVDSKAGNVLSEEDAKYHLKKWLQ